MSGLSVLKSLDLFGAMFDEALKSLCTPALALPFLEGRLALNYGFLVQWLLFETEVSCFPQTAVSDVSQKSLQIPGEDKLHKSASKASIHKSKKLLSCSSHRLESKSRRFHLIISTLQRKRPSMLQKRLSFSNRRLKL
jgi:hypothetical protein